ncbi:hypothetical protein HRbin27_01940 [bacterium HR27]|nr:hypothetical protein HRbin27_01940 [bacterium HR27]
MVAFRSLGIGARLAAATFAYAMGDTGGEKYESGQTEQREHERGKRSGACAGAWQDLG